MKLNKSIFTPIKQNPNASNAIKINRANQSIYLMEFLRILIVNTLSKVYLSVLFNRYIPDILETVTINNIHVTIFRLKNT